ncbi:hypothetical protein POJ06DRAFT_299395 [Lipomyces tetrasporus]|uniref:Cenp-O kinetochore centromere component n=1 Tax=Lipomyces tetrasporus TaxID=54092 RepID=A0AAD7QX79_9ASCO|nr:uncharacterized protein POJ06DRAFT_299395 [Lipomyces tetrasporus]KAJ8103129.1 hypothetical protein POJ06DRAFT_299395 [Lipomyces tetrasporus]
MSSKDKYRVDITSLKSELTLLSRKRAQLASRLACLKSSKTIVPEHEIGLTQSNGVSDELLERDRERGKMLLAHLSEKYDHHQNIHLQNLYRLAGVTAFKVRDPSANGHGDLLGVRIECFALKKFSSPHYIILSVSEKTKSYGVYKHTVPLHIPLASLAKKYLDRDLGMFVRAVRKQIILDINKRTHLSCLSHVIAIEADDACELVKLEFEFPKYGECTAYLRCDMVDIKSAVVTKYVPTQAEDLEVDEELLEEETETVRDDQLEALIPGRIDQLHRRLATIE